MDWYKRHLSPVLHTERYKHELGAGADLPMNMWFSVKNLIDLILGACEVNMGFIYGNGSKHPTLVSCRHKKNILANPPVVVTCVGFSDLHKWGCTMSLSQPALNVEVWYQGEQGLSESLNSPFYKKNWPISQSFVNEKQTSQTTHEQKFLVSNWFFLCSNQRV